MHRRIVVGLLLFLLMYRLSVLARGANEPVYKLVWADEFNTGGAPESSNWSYENGFVRNNEYQWYQPANARCNNGLLIIEARRETMQNPWYVAGNNDWRKKDSLVHYTSSCINTSGKHAWQYGRFEMRGRIDISNGLWPAWWTLGVSQNWPANGEIDIMEYYRKQLLANIACLGSNSKPQWFSKITNTDSLGGQAWASKFHTWKMDWDENAIALSVDDTVLIKVPLSTLDNKDGSGINPFRQPHYMLLNLAVGGDNGGDPSKTPFPRRFEVDYVRVYQRE